MKFITAVISLVAAVSAVSATSCSKTQFGYNSKLTGDCCLSTGGSSNPSSCPSGKSCPSGWQWHGGFSCCVPTQPNQPSQTKSCQNGHSWFDDEQCCKGGGSNPPKPTRGLGARDDVNAMEKRHAKRGESAKLASRNWRAKTLSCPTGQTICNVSDGLSSSTWACVDTDKDINFCGGCGIRGNAGQDCSAIPNVWNVACNLGACEVLTCEPGFRVSRDGKRCVRMD
ncbi:hypothetical protein DL93DRAFT_2090349 [Clavulina sp. PMI_390]|nr:hypothetical protein DL93DRAFT_2090349 [Clavulina sp. PMI_390]